mmetsp:Transcript_6223/g.22085  ORF Transcript_6223/g.22085 Transcript_6223/m.22085 type:complete len:105 (+) Transcript_6223:525-839(+)
MVSRSPMLADCAHDMRRRRGGSRHALLLFYPSYRSPLPLLVMCLTLAQWKEAPPVLSRSQQLRMEQRQALAAVKEAMPMVVDAGGVVQKLNEEKETGDSVLLGS